MKLFTWLALPALAVSTSALVIPSVEELSHDAAAAIAGSIALTNTTQSSHSKESAIELEYQKLDVLKQQLHDIHHEVLRQERQILELIKSDFRICSGVKCYLQTALKKAPDFFELFKTHFRHYGKDSGGLDGCPWSVNSSSPEHGQLYFDEETHGDPAFTFDGEESHHDEGPFRFGDGPEERPEFPHHRPPPPHHEDKPSGFDDLHDTVHPHPHSKPGIHPDHHNDVSSDHPPYEPNKPNTASPASHPHDPSIFSDSKPHHSRPPFHMPHPAPRPRHYRLILATAGSVISLLILGILFKALRVYCANPRVRADRAARIEECRTKREYRRAACQHRLRQCLSRFRRRSRSRSTDDYEEKRAMLQSRNLITESNIENHIIGADIDSLRRAHEIVGQLMRAEEGRSLPLATHQQQLPHNQAQAESSENPNLPSSSRSLRSIRTTTTLPPYGPPPPRYSQELEREIHIVDGFRYTPTHSGVTVSSSASSFILDDDFTESSVVDCRSRMSMETENETEVATPVSTVYSTVSVPTITNTRRNPTDKDLELFGDQFRGRFD